MEFFPTLALCLSVFLGVPVPLTTDLQTRAIDDQIDRSLWHTINLTPDFQRGIAS
jgi:hypothetical protein